MRRKAEAAPDNNALEQTKSASAGRRGLRCSTRCCTDDMSKGEACVVELKEIPSFEWLPQP